MPTQTPARADVDLLVILQCWAERNGTRDQSFAYPLMTECDSQVPGALRALANA